jgi:hypothetical protein
VLESIDYFILTRNLWNILNDIKVIPIISLEGDHGILIADFRKVAEQRPLIYQDKKFNCGQIANYCCKVAVFNEMNVGHLN